MKKSIPIFIILSLLFFAFILINFESVNAGGVTKGMPSGRTGIFSAGYRTCFLKSNGNVDCQGKNNVQQANDYNSGNALAVSAGQDHTCILKSNGETFCQGSGVTSYSASTSYAGDVNPGSATGVTTDEVTCVTKTNGFYCYGAFGISSPNSNPEGIASGSNLACDMLGSYVYCQGNLGSLIGDFYTFGSGYSCPPPPCQCSGNSCNPSNNGQRCDSCEYYSVAGTVEACNNIDEDCDGTIDEGLSQACGNCGTQTCSAGTWSSCTGQGVCSPGSTQSCGSCGTESCTSSCQWNNMCVEGSCEILSAYWADMAEATTNKADKFDKIKIITLAQSLLYNQDVSIKVYESQTLFGLGILDWINPDNLITTITHTIDSTGKGVSQWQIPDAASSTYYYAYAESSYGTSEPTWYLNASSVEYNNKPNAVITFPNYDSINNYKFSVGQEITFTQSSYDIDDNILTYSWDFDTGNPATSTSPNPSPVSYLTAGSNYITLAVTDERGGTSLDTAGILIDDPATNQAPLVAITSPESGVSYSNSVLIDATKTIDDNTLFENLLFTWYFDGVIDSEHTNVAGLAGATFTKVFDTSGVHTIAVMVDDGE